MSSLATIVTRFPQRFALNLAFIGMTGALTCLAWLLISQLQGKLVQIAEYTAERESMLQREEILRASSLDLKEKLGSVKTVLESLQAKFPPIPEESQFLHALSKRASEAGVSLSEFRPGGVSKRPDCKEIELRLRGTGQYASICRWLDSLSEVPRFVRVSNISFSGPSAPGGDCIVDIELDLMFGLSEPPQIATSHATASQGTASQIAAVVQP